MNVALVLHVLPVEQGDTVDDPPVPENLAETLRDALEGFTFEVGDDQAVWEVDFAEWNDQ